jgi:hypothetical protein
MKFRNQTIHPVVSALAFASWLAAASYLTWFSGSLLVVEIAALNTWIAIGVLSYVLILRFFQPTPHVAPSQIMQKGKVHGLGVVGTFVGIAIVVAVAPLLLMLLCGHALLRRATGKTA